MFESFEENQIVRKIKNQGVALNSKNFKFMENFQLIEQNSLLISIINTLLPIQYISLKNSLSCAKNSMLGEFLMLRFEYTHVSFQGTAGKQLSSRCQVL